MKILKNNFVTNVMLLMSGTVIAQIITFLLLPIITRIYGPELYGILGTFLAISSVLTPIAALTYQIAIVLPKQNSESKILVSLSTIIVILMSLITLIIIYLFGEYLIVFLKLEDFESYLFYIPLSISIMGFHSIIIQWLIREKRFKSISKVIVYQTIFSYLIIILIGISNPLAVTLILVSIFKYLFGICMLIYFNDFKVRLNQKITLNKQKVLEYVKVAKKYKDFPLYRFPEVLISSFAQNIPVILLASIFNPAAAGFYTLGKTALGMPGQIIGKAFSDVFYPKIAENSNDKLPIYNLVFKASLFLFLIGLVPFGLIMFWGPFIFSTVFGEEWWRAGEYAQWIALMTLAMFITRPVIQSLAVINAQRFHLIFTILLTIIRLTSMYFGLKIIENDLFAIQIYSISSSIMYLLLLIFTLLRLKNFNKINIDY